MDVQRQPEKAEFPRLVAFLGAESWSSGTSVDVYIEIGTRY
jgi:hypothetical protein